MTGLHIGYRLALTLAGGVLLPSVPAAAQDRHAERTAARILDELRSASGVPGLGAAVSRDGKTLWTGSAGFRDLERKLPVTRDTRFRFASVSKVFAATAAARLRQEGKLDVDAPVATMLPYLKNDWPAISSRQLAAHISGLPHYQDVDAKRGGVRYATMPKAVAIFSGRTLLSPPGTRYTYSSWGYTLLSAVVEARSGTPYLDYVTRTIAPGLAIGPDTTGSSDTNASRAYAMENGAPLESAPHDYSYTWGGGGLGGTPVALAEWGGRLLRGDIVSAQTLAWMAEPTRLNDGSIVKDEDYQLGFGWRTRPDLDGHALMHHAGITLGARTVLVLVPEQKIAISLLANALWVASIDRSALTVAAPFRTVPALAPHPCPVKAARYTGSFNGEPVAGSVRFAVEDGICSATLSADNALGAWLENVSKRKTASVRLIGIDKGDGFARGALVTPVGAYELRPAGSGYTAAIGSTRSLTVEFQ